MKAFSLVEALMAILILSLLSLAMYRLFSFGESRFRQMSYRFESATFAREVLINPEAQTDKAGLNATVSLNGREKNVRVAPGEDSQVKNAAVRTYLIRMFEQGSP
ncbi:MAG: hypothetical protein JNM63_05560 [Spirochaetia bacterium]|nr:hypothetical protein [Spirochaetia bacterium]